MVRRSSMPITRCPKVEGKASPLDPKLREYWLERKKRTTARQIYQRGKLELLRQQQGECGFCHLLLSVEDMDEHHIIPRHAGGQNTLDNRMLVHRWCHHAHHQRVGYKSKKA